MKKGTRIALLLKELMNAGVGMKYKKIAMLMDLIAP